MSIRVNRYTGALSLGMCVLLRSKKIMDLTTSSRRANIPTGEKLRELLEGSEHKATLAIAKFFFQVIIRYN